jgi:hypothetical protein
MSRDTMRDVPETTTRVFAEKYDPMGRNTFDFELKR